MLKQGIGEAVWDRGVSFYGRRVPHNSIFPLPHVNKSSVDLTDPSEATPEDGIVRQVNLVNSLWPPNSKNVHILASHHL